jgi:hypothetical protein
VYRTGLVLGDKKASKRSVNPSYHILLLLRNITVEEIRATWQRSYDPRGLHAVEYDIWLTPKEEVRGIDDQMMIVLYGGVHEMIETTRCVPCAVE